MSARLYSVEYVSACICIWVRYTVSLLRNLNKVKRNFPDASWPSRPTCEEHPAFCNNRSEMEGKNSCREFRIGTVANGRAGLGLHPQSWWSILSTINNKKKWFRKKLIISKKSGVLLQFYHKANGTQGPSG